MSCPVCGSDTHIHCTRLSKCRKCSSDGSAFCFQCGGCWNCCTCELSARLVAHLITPQQYLQLRNTVRIIRMSGAPLDSGQERQVKRFEATIREYQRVQTEANG